MAALAEAAGAEVRLLGIARDTRESLDAHFAQARDADVIVTIGGASVGDHDLVGPVLEARGMALAFWKIAMRPGQAADVRPAGRKPACWACLAIPSRRWCARACSSCRCIRALLGLPARGEEPVQARAGVALEANGPRQHYMRATSTPGADGLAVVTPVRSQDSSLLAPLAEADCLLVRPPHAPPLAARAAWCRSCPSIFEA